VPSRHALQIQPDQKTEVFMKNITLEVIKDQDLAQCQELCNELMAFQKSKATIHPEWFDSMNFETRMQTSYAAALSSHVVVAKDNGLPIGYVFSTINLITEADKDAYPSWVSLKEQGRGFYPDWLEVPQKVGCLNNLYIKDNYRGLGLGQKLFDLTMAWLESQSGVDINFVYISNGNDEALNFYLSNGFIFGYEVFNGFIQAAYKQKI
jgi:GNAT superfamily N-acetyltransferase